VDQPLTGIEQQALMAVKHAKGQCLAQAQHIPHFLQRYAVDFVRQTGHSQTKPWTSSNLQLDRVSNAG
jgi:hypothetical protein